MKKIRKHWTHRGEAWLLFGVLCIVTMLLVFHNLDRQSRFVCVLPVRSVYFEQEPREQIDLNHANINVLKTLPGIGETLALRIVEYRKVHDGFKNVYEITQVEGIGRGKFLKIREWICAG